MKRGLQVITFLIVFFTIGCKTKQKAISTDKVDVKKETQSDVDSSIHTIDQSTTNKTETETSEAEFIEETTFNADSAKTDMHGNTTFYIGGKPVTNKKKGSKKQLKTSNEQKQNNIVIDKDVSAHHSAKLDSTSKKKESTKQVETDSAGKTWGIVFGIGCTIALIVYIIISKKK